MTKLNLTPDQLKERRRKQEKRRYRRDKARILEYKRALRRGDQHNWWWQACIKAGVPAWEVAMARERRNATIDGVRKTKTL